MAKGYKAFTVRTINKAKMKDLLPFLELIAYQQDLKLSKSREMKICSKILIKSINQN